MKTPVLIVFGNLIELVSESGTRSRTLPDGAELTAAAVQLITEAGAPPKYLHILYHPVDLVVSAAECANLPRYKLKKYFTPEHRILANPATLWGATKPAAHLDGKFTTVLHYEGRPRLDNLIQALEAAGSTTRVILPPAAVLAARTKVDQLELAILAAGGAFLFYSVNELLIPSVRFTRSPETLFEDLSNAISARKNPPGAILIVANEATPELIETLRTQNLADKAVTIPWAAFAGEVAFAPADSANFAIRPFQWKARHTLATIAAIFAVASIYLAVDYTKKTIAATALERDLTDRRTVLQEEVVHLEQAEARYNDALSLVRLVPIETPRPSQLLDAVTSALPTTLALKAFSYQAGQFTLEGIAFEGIGQDKSPLTTFAETLTQGERTWALKPAKPLVNGAAWTITGSFADPTGTKKSL